MSNAMSLPHTFVFSAPVGTTSCRTPTKRVFDESTPSLLTKKSLTGRSLPNVDVAQSISLGPDSAVTQCRAVATRLGANKEPEQSPTCWLFSMTATTNG